ncbi:hypothetical protein Tco_1344875 [Tanacetum coccineum]
MGSHNYASIKRLPYDELKELFETTNADMAVQPFHSQESDGEKTVPELTTTRFKKGLQKSNRIIEVFYRSTRLMKLHWKQVNVEALPVHIQIKTEEGLSLRNHKKVLEKFIRVGNTHTEASYTMFAEMLQKIMKRDGICPDDAIFHAGRETLTPLVHRSFRC